MTKKTIYGLFVGINEYNGNIVIQNRAMFPPLNGCVADVEAVRQRLEQEGKHFNLQFLTLKDKQATKNAVVDAFDKHLGRARANDVVFIYYAGHGTQEKADQSIWTAEHDGLLEGIVCYYEQGDAGKLILADKELRWLLNKLWRKTQAHIVAMFDCCHSGDNTRSLGSSVEAPLVARHSRSGLSFDQRPWSDFIFAKELSPDAVRGREMDAVMPPGVYLQMSAAESNEPALEQGGHGVFTLALLDALKQSGGNLTYRELNSRIRNRLRNRFDQRPRLHTPEGAEELADMGFLTKSVTRQNDQATLMYNAADKTYSIDRGALAGVTAGLTSVTAGNAVGRIMAAQLDRATVVFDAEKPAQNDQTVTLTGLAQRQLHFQLVNKDATDAQVDTLLARMSQDDLQHIVMWEDDPKKADYTLWLWRGMAYLTKPGDAFRPLFEPVRLNEPKFAEKMARRLFHVSQWETMVRLQNTQTSSLKPDAIEVTFLQETADGQWETLPARNGQITIQPQKNDQDKWQRRLQIRLKNNTRKDLYVAVALLDFDFSVNAAYMLNPSVPMLGAGQEKWLRDHKGKVATLALDDTCYWYNWPSASTWMKVFFSTEQFTVDNWNLDALPKPLTPDSATRGFVEEDEDVDENMRGPKVSHWNSVIFEQVLTNPLYNRVKLEHQSSMFGQQTNGKVNMSGNAPYLAHFALGLYAPDKDAPKTQKTKRETDQPQEPTQMRGMLYDTMLAAANKWAGFWREKTYEKMLETYKGQPTLVSEGDSWFQHPLLNDIIDNVGKYYPIHCLAHAGDTISNYLKKGAFAQDIAKTQPAPAIFLLSGGGNDILGESLRALLQKSEADALEGQNPGRFFNAHFAKALEDLEELYRTVFMILRQQQPHLHILIHGYDYVRPLEPNSKKTSWLGKYLDEYGIVRAGDRTAVTHYMMDEFNQRLMALAGAFPNVHYIDLRGTVNDNQWYDEIHPNDDGYQKVSLKFLQKISDILARQAQN